MIKFYIILAIMTLIGSVASFFLKKASTSKNIILLIKNKNIYFGGILYVTSAVLNIYLLKYLDYSVVLPLTSITYIWTLLISSKFLNETISLRKILGIVLIGFGSLLLSI